MRRAGRLSRAALLPTPGDPFLVGLWLKSFENIWSREVDKLYVHVNSYLDAETVGALLERLKSHPKVVVLYDDCMVDHGNSMARLTRECAEDLVMFIEDDAFILKKGAVDSCFRQIEDGRFDLLGSPRGCCSADLYDRGMKLFGEPKIGFDCGPNFWPNFLFCRRADLLRTDLRFGAHTFKEGDFIPALDYAVEGSSAHGDTFVWGSLQMRGLGLKCGLIEQHKVHPNDFDEHHRRENCFSSHAPWFHSGNLSGSLHSWLRGPDGMPLGGPKSSLAADMSVTPEEAKGHGLQDDFERRVTYLSIAWESAAGDYPSLGAFARRYKQAVDLFVHRYNLRPDMIGRRIKIYKELLAPALRGRAPWFSFPARVLVIPSMRTNAVRSSAGKPLRFVDSASLKG